MPSGTRDRLLDAALRAFAVDGVEGTPVTDLEHAAGLAAGSGGFYRYFRTKDEVLEAAVRREIERIRGARETAEPTTDPDRTQPAERRAAVAADIDRALDMLRTIGPLVAILARERERIPHLAKEIAEELVAGGVEHEQSVIGRGDAVGAVALSATVGYHLATSYFGGPPAGVGRDEFVATLAELLTAE